MVLGQMRPAERENRTQSIRWTSRDRPQDSGVISIDGLDPVALIAHVPKHVPWVFTERLDDPRAAIDIQQYMDPDLERTVTDRHDGFEFREGVVAAKHHV